MESRSSRNIAIAAAVLASGLAAYAIYFDYKRRNDADFRKKLRKEKKRVDRSVAQEQKQGPESSLAHVTPEMLRDALEEIKKEEGPASVEEKEAYFMAQVSAGEHLCAAGPASYLPAAKAFFRALRVYPAPVELIVIYQKTVPEPVFKLVMEMTNLDITSRVEGYYDHFPPKSTNVSIIPHHMNGGSMHKVLVVNKDIAAGEIIYKEHPIVAALDGDVQPAGTHCAHCFRVIQSDIAIREDCILPSTFCSDTCLTSSNVQSTALLFTLDPVLPPELPSPDLSPTASEVRKKAQSKFVKYIKKEGRITPILAARFIARQIAAETNKLAGTGQHGLTEQNDFTDAEQPGYLLANHIERLRFIDVNYPKEEFSLLTSLLQVTLPGLEKFITDEHYKTLLGKMSYNSFGICFGDGRDAKPQPTARPENIERTRTPYGTQRQIGSALYNVSSYITHSCAPSARPSFVSGTTELHLIANRDLKKGDELSIAFVDVNQHEGESVVECRRRRRIEIARGWRFACPCDRCSKEAMMMTEEERGGNADDGRDDSKIEDSMGQFEAGE